MRGSWLFGLVPGATFQLTETQKSFRRRSRRMGNWDRQICRSHGGCDERPARSPATELEVQIEEIIVTDENLARTASILRSAPGTGPADSMMLIGQAASPVAHNSGAIRSKRAIGGGHRLLRHVLFQVALGASPHHQILKLFADRRRAAGKPHKLVITAGARKRGTFVRNEPTRPPDKHRG